MKEVKGILGVKLRGRNTKALDKNERIKKGGWELFNEKYEIRCRRE